MLFTKKIVLRELKYSKDYVEQDGSWLYIGKLTKHKNENKNKVAYKAYRMWGKQGERCYNPHNCSFKYYGIKKIKRIWKSREFINWFIEQILSRESWEYPVVSRKKDKGDYSIRNCELLERSENSTNVTKARKKGRTRKELERDIVKLLKENKIENRIIKDIRNLF